MKQLLALVFIFFILPLNSISQVKTGAANTDVKPSQKQHTVIYGQASYYASKFHGRKTANGEIFYHKKKNSISNSI